MILNEYFFQISWQQIPVFTAFVFDAFFSNFRIHIVKVKVAFLSCMDWFVIVKIWKMAGKSFYST